MLFNGEIGIVHALSDSQITIAFTSKDACETCGLKVVCAPGKQSNRILTLPNPGQLTLGQKVKLEELANLELHLALIQFGLPMVAFLFGLILGYFSPQHLFPKELAAFLIGLAGLGLSYFIARHLVQKIVDIIPDKYLKLQPQS